MNNSSIRKTNVYISVSLSSIKEYSRTTWINISSSKRALP